MLQVTEKIGFGRLAAVEGVTPLDETFRDHTGTNATQSVYSFPSRAVGPASDDRSVVAAVITRASGTDPGINSVQITEGSITMTQIGSQQSFNSGGGIRTGFFGSMYTTANNPGSTASFTVTMASNVVRCAIVIWQVDFLMNFTEHDSDFVGTSGTAAMNATVNVVGGGAVFGCGFLGSGAAAYSGLTTRVANGNFSSIYHAGSDDQGSRPAFEDDITGHAVSVTGGSAPRTLHVTSLAPGAP